ncbi:hypothetical protein IFR05_000643 [Cadophora sp. M221]|nr:hypothetical protein IFR05_000643 [Cadophora sp. M221]
MDEAVRQARRTAGDKEVQSHLTSHLFVYPEIDPKTEIRILKLSRSYPGAHRDNLGGAISGSFVVAKLADNPQYEALSYAWGDPVFSHSLKFPGGYLPITEHLYSALLNLRWEYKPRRLWVDAVCIDQMNDLEKGHQVALMADIYRGTERVLAWLGHREPRSGNFRDSSTISFLEELSAASRTLGTESVVPTKSKAQDTTERLSSSAVLKILDINRVFASRRDSIAAFFESSWFRRLWIVQESVLPPSLTFFVGREELEFEDFSRAMSVLMRLNKHPNPPYLFFRGSPDVEMAWELVCLRAANQEREDGEDDDDDDKLTFLDLVVNNIGRLCKDPKDRINALLGLQGLCKENQFQINADYSLSDDDAFRLFATQHLMAQDLRCLHYAGITESFSEHERTPSWIPNWASNADRLKGHIGQHQPSQFSSCIQAKPYIDLSPGQLNIIGIRGVILDTVKIDLLFQGTSQVKAHAGIGARLHENFLRGLDAVQTISGWEDLCIKSYPESRKYHTGEGIDAVLARTLVLDNKIQRPKSISNTLNDAGDRIVHSWRKYKCSNRHGLNCQIPNCLTIPKCAGQYPFIAEAKVVGSHRTLFTTKTGYIGLGPVLLQSRDVIVVFDGAETPFVLRKVEDDTSDFGVSNLSPDGERATIERWQLVGDCYVHGFMDNEVLRPDFDGKNRMFWLV